MLHRRTARFDKASAASQCRVDEALQVARASRSLDRGGRARQFDGVVDRARGMGEAHRVDRREAPTRGGLTSARSWHAMAGRRTSSKAAIGHWRAEHASPHAPSNRRRNGDMGTPRRRRGEAAQHVGEGHPQRGGHAPAREEQAVTDARRHERPDGSVAQVARRCFFRSHLATVHHA